MRRALTLLPLIALVHCASPGAAGNAAASTAPEAAAGRSAEDPAAKAADIRRLLVLTGAGEIGVQVMDQMLVQFRQMLPQVPEAFWAELKAEVQPAELVELVVPIYDRHFTHDEIKAIIAFYETPEGRRFVEKLPALTRESQAAGETWGRELGEKVAERLRTEGYLRQ